ncbi:hypothetical protein BDV59DRAFT_195848 [Aspergillus ambiguus]|uniref:uncharacterized protein n=1 Tax=Aspergillus ambiguus TaxID=176160 RepID=UPI003CCCD066
MSPVLPARVKGHYKCLRCHSVSKSRGNQCHMDAKASTFECCSCKRHFASEAALRQHLHDKIHQDLQRKTAHRCEDCNRVFPSKVALEQHMRSPIHKPLANLRCVTETCRLTFNVPSALIHHLESGSCSSGWTREKINSVLHQYDSDRLLTTRSVSLNTTLSNDSLSSLVSSSSYDILTPAEGSETDSDLGAVLITSSPRDVHHNRSMQTNLFCPLCQSDGKKRCFKNRSALHMHISSPAHAERSFKCPIAFSGPRSSPAGQVQRFATLSGLTQHLESGRCGGKRTLWKTLEYLQKDVFRFEWPGNFILS